MESLLVKFENGIEPRRMLSILENMVRIQRGLDKLQEGSEINRI